MAYELSISYWISDVCAYDLHMRLLCYKSTWHGGLACRKLQLRILPLRRSPVRQEYRHADTRPSPPWPIRLEFGKPFHWLVGCRCDGKGRGRSPRGRKIDG